MIETAARIAHEVTRAYCLAQGDLSQVSWDDAPEWQQKIVRAGVCAILKDPLTTPEMSHEGWSKEKIKEGWVYGETKDPVAKTHPCLVPYHELPEAQKVKDYLYGGAVRASLGITFNPEGDKT